MLSIIKVNSFFYACNVQLERKIESLFNKIHKIQRNKLESIKNSYKIHTYIYIYRCISLNKCDVLATRKPTVKKLC
jgi:hypothetical protein